MKRLLNTLISVLLVVSLVVLMPACGKYEEGPGISLLSKKNRLVNTWKIQKYFENNVDKTSIYLDAHQDFTLEISKDGTYRSEFYYPGTGIPIISSGTWAFDEAKEMVIFTPASDFGNSKILRLANNELWLKNELSSFMTYEFHLIPN